MLTILGIASVILSKSIFSAIGSVWLVFTLLILFCLLISGCDEIFVQITKSRFRAFHALGRLICLLLSVCGATTVILGVEFDQYYMTNRQIDVPWDVDSKIGDVIVFGSDYEVWKISSWRMCEYDPDPQRYSYWLVWIDNSLTIAHGWEWQEELWNWLLSILHGGFNHECINSVWYEKRLLSERPH